MNNALIINEDARTKDAMDYLQDFFNNIKNGTFTDIEQKLIKKFEGKDKRTLWSLCFAYQNWPCNSLLFPCNQQAEWRTNRWILWSHTVWMNGSFCLLRILTALSAAVTTGGVALSSYEMSPFKHWAEQWKCEKILLDTIAKLSSHWNTLFSGCSWLTAHPWTRTFFSVRYFDFQPMEP